MTAEEMFEKLKYRKKEREDLIEYTKRWGNRVDSQISFDTTYKTVTAFGEQRWRWLAEIDLIKAIAQQCKELGWLDE